MLDADTREPLWRHQALDADGIATPGVLVFYIVFCFRHED